MSANKRILPIYELHTDLPKEVQGVISDIVECYQNNKPCNLIIERSFDFKRAIYITTENRHIRFSLMTEVIANYSDQIAHWVSYLTRNIDADYIIEDDGKIFEE